jgi:hypothetical protein
MLLFNYPKIGGFNDEREIEKEENKEGRIFIPGHLPGWSTGV